MLLKKIMDKDVISTFANYSVKLLLNPLLIIAIPIYLTPISQGFWYTFGSIAAFTSLVDAGFTLLITQFSAHEFAYLEWQNGQIKGNEENIQRLLSIFKFSLTWASIAISVAIPIIFIFGFNTFKNDKTNIVWLVPWFLYLLGSSLNFILSVMFSFFEGCKQLFKIQKIRLFNSVIQTFLTLLFLYLKLNLYSLAISVLVTSFFSLLQLGYYFKSFIRDIDWKIRSSFNWVKEFMPLFIKYILSWIGGYMSLNLFTIFAFNFIGSEYSGKVGISLTIVLAIFSISNIWMYVFTPRINFHSAKKEWNEMWNMFVRGCLLSLLTFTFSSALFLLIFSVFKNTHIIQRFLSMESMIMLLISFLFQLFINSSAIYLRAFKEEPFIKLSLINGAYIVTATYLNIIFGHERLFFIGLITSYAFTIPWVIIMLINKRKELL